MTDGTHEIEANDAAANPVDALVRCELPESLKDPQEVLNRGRKALKEERILKIFEEAGIRLELGATFSAKGQIAQLLNGAEKLIEECAAIAEKQKPGTIYQWTKDSLWGNIVSNVAKKIRNFNA